MPNLHHITDYNAPTSAVPFGDQDAVACDGEGGEHRRALGGVDGVDVFGDEVGEGEDFYGCEEG